MKRITLLIVGLCTWSLGSGCGGSESRVMPTRDDAGTTHVDSSDGSYAPSSLQGTAFDIEGDKPDSSPRCMGPCKPATVLITHHDDSSIKAVWGATGRATEFSLTKTHEGWKLDDNLLVSFEEQGDHQLCPTTTTLTSATFDFEDRDGDRRPDLTISGHQQTEYCADDYKSGNSGAMTLKGVPHARTPVALGPKDEFYPVGGVDIQLTEPLKPTATGMLVPAKGGSSISLESVLLHGYVIGFSTKSVLPLGMSYEAKIAGTSFAGPEGVAPIPLRTFHDIGVLKQDGFESGSLEGISGGEIVTSWLVPPIDGKRMLLVKPGARVMLRLRRENHEQRLVLQARATYHCSFSPPSSLTMETAVVGSDTVHREQLSMGNTIEKISLPSPQDPVTIGAVQTISVPLGKSDGDVLVYMQGESYRGAGCNVQGAVLDNVHLE